MTRVYGQRRRLFDIEILASRVTMGRRLQDTLILQILYTCPFLKKLTVTGGVSMSKCDGQAEALALGSHHSKELVHLIALATYLLSVSLCRIITSVFYSRDPNALVLVTSAVVVLLEYLFFFRRYSPAS